MNPKVTLLPNNLQFEVEPGETILAAAIRHKIQPPYSCRQATCGVCRAQVSEGSVFYAEDIPLLALHEDEIEAGYCLPCSAEINADVTLQWDEVLAPGEIKVRSVQADVVSVTAINADTYTVRMQLPIIDTPRFYAGQYLQLVLGADDKRPFSIASAPEALPQLELHIRAFAGHEKAEEIIAHFQARKSVHIELPFGRSYLRDSERPLLMIAGGTGITPMKSMLESMHARGDVRPVHLYWGGRDQGALYWDAQWRAFVAQWPGLHYHPVLPESGILPHVLAAQQLPLTDMAIYCSGSMEMVKAVYADYRACGVLPENFHSDLIDILRAGGQLND